ncbi:MAG: hypothetical protein CMJ81_11755 [Planctomycetaceae bacterium]|nr:hypothetical protein [Planctomycetaceae bacterium]
MWEVIVLWKVGKRNVEFLTFYCVLRVRQVRAALLTYGTLYIMGPGASHVLQVTRCEDGSCWGVSVESESRTQFEWFPERQPVSGVCQFENSQRCL